MLDFIATRREFLQRCAAASAAAMLAPRGAAWAAPAGKPPFLTRGVVLTPSELTLADWPQRAKRAGLTTIALHPFPNKVADFIRSDSGRRFLEQCRELELEVEYELHAVRELMPRERFKTEPDLFRMDDKGVRTPDANCCPSNKDALTLIAEAAVEIARTLRPTTGRYFYWGDDSKPWCRCPKCRGLSESDQALLIENAMCAALRRIDPNAQLAHLAYSNTLMPPKRVKPAEGVFLEYAPFNRRYDVPYEEQKAPGDRDSIAALDANLEVFPRDTAQVLEYWLDIGMLSGRARSKQLIKLDWKKDAFLADLESYRKRGIRHVTTFATGVNPTYQKLHGDLSFIDEYGEGLSQ